LPDYREFALVGAEENTTDVYNASTNPNGTIHDHDVYTEGQAKDDQLQDHKHYVESQDGYKYSPGQFGAGTSYSVSPTGTGINIRANTIFNGRHGTVTRGKRKAVYFYIKATSGLSENAQDDVANIINGERSYSTSEVNTGKKWIDGKPIYRKVIEGSITAVDMDINHNIANIDSLVNVIPYMVSNDGNTVNTPFNISTTYYFTSYATKTQLKIMAGSTYVNANKYRMILEYTKTTD
jgi:hypothetical protein